MGLAKIPSPRLLSEVWVVLCAYFPMYKLWDLEKIMKHVFSVGSVTGINYSVSAMLQFVGAQFRANSWGLRGILFPSYFFISPSYWLIPRFGRFRVIFLHISSKSAASVRSSWRGYRSLTWGSGSCDCFLVSYLWFYRDYPVIYSFELLQKFFTFFLN